MAVTEGWVDSSNSLRSMKILKHAKDHDRPVILLVGAGISVDSGFPVASQLTEYLVQLRYYVDTLGFASARQYVEEARWPSRHDLRIELMLQNDLQLGSVLQTAELNATQAALISELRRPAPTLAGALLEVFQQNNPKAWNVQKLRQMYAGLKPIADALGSRSPGNIAFRSHLMNLCEGDQTAIDACLDHFTRDRTATSTHQFIYFLTRELQIPVILSTNFDPLLEYAFTSEGVIPRVYEVQGEGTIPSANVLLSQPLSIVKLHGGAHQMRTGFDLDDPMSPSALDSFSQLYAKLRKRSDQDPLTVVMGYSGSDRRVMDIIAGRIREWEDPVFAKKPQEKPKPSKGVPSDKNAELVDILWVSRDGNPPGLLKSSVDTHPNVMRQGGRAERWPAHCVKYRDGRLFLMEALQTLIGHFPIARTYYQAVNFVPHSVSGRDRSVANLEKFKGDWRAALVLTESGGGSSSTLVAIAEMLEQDEGYRTLWIDLTEVSGVSALMDLISERIVKLDARLQPIRRPPLLTSLNSPGVTRTENEKCSEAHELLLSVQWLRQALRRGKYLLALDSLDEFPSDHPALAHLADELKTAADPLNSDPTDQRRLMKELINALVEHPKLLGDSRIAIAYSPSGKKSAKVASSQETLEVPTSSDEKQEPTAFEEIVIKFRGSTDKQRVIAPILESATTEGGSFIEQFRDLTTADGFSEKNKNVEAFICSVIVLIASCARRVRSEALLVQSTVAFLYRLSGKKTDDEPCLKQLGEFLKGDNGRASISKGSKKNERLSFLRGNKLQAIYENFWKEAVGNAHHFTNRQDEALIEMVRECVHRVALHGHEENTVSKHLSKPRRWLHRTEGGYHWMHRDVRNNLYMAFQRGRSGSALALAHHVIALYCYDELYERSRDTRAFLEYFFHRLAAIRSALHYSNTNSRNTWLAASGWVTRLVIAMHREKHDLLKRGRMPGLIQLLSELDRTIRDIKDAGRNKKVNKEIKTLIHNWRQLCQFRSDCLLASGHPHSSLTICAARLNQKRLNIPAFESSEGLELDESDMLKIPKLLRHEIQDEIRAIRDIAYACQDPMLSRWPFPQFSKSVEKNTDTWADWLNTRTNAKRKTRLTLCQNAYIGLLKSRPKELDKLKPWDEHDEVGEFYDGLIRKAGDFLLLDHPECWIASSKAYLVTSTDKGNVASPALKNLAEWELGVNKEREHLPTDELLNPTLLNTPLLRRHGRRLRHECYRLCIEAKLIIAKAWKFEGIEIPSRASAVIGTDSTEWHEATWNLAVAEAVLKRTGDPADQQAMAITRLITAELHLRQAEFRHWWCVGRDRNDKDVARQVNQTEQAVSAVASMLSTVETIMNEGRGENRWRFFYLLTLARVHMLKAEKNRDSAPRNAAIDLRTAGRHLVGALLNCGLWTDRFDVLMWWWNVWKHCLHKLYSEPAQRELEEREMYKRLGIRWEMEPQAKGSGRFTSNSTQCRVEDTHA